MGESQMGKYFLSLSGPAYIMGILNVTPDSFPDGGQSFRPEDAVVHALEMQRQGAGMVDIDGRSTHPGFTAVPPQGEWERIEPVLKALQGHLGTPVSVDTSYPQVTSMALSAGADVTSDVNGFTDPAMLPAVLQNGYGYIIIHNGHVLEKDPEGDTLFRAQRLFEDKLRQAQEIGTARGRICFDPGVEFDKTYRESLRLIASVDAVCIKGCAFSMAASREGVIGKSCGGPPAEDRMSGTLAAHTLMQVGSTQLLHVHDVRKAVRATQVAYAVLSAKAGGTSLE